MGGPARHGSPQQVEVALAAGHQRRGERDDDAGGRAAPLEDRVDQGAADPAVAVGDGWVDSNWACAIAAWARAGRSSRLAKASRLVMYAARSRSSRSRTLPPAGWALHEPQDDEGLVLVDDGVQKHAGAVAVRGGPLVGELVVAGVGWARVLEELLEAGVDLPAGLGRGRLAW